MLMIIDIFTVSIWTDAESRALGRQVLNLLQLHTLWRIMSHMYGATTARHKEMIAAEVDLGRVWDWSQMLQLKPKMNCHVVINREHLPSFLASFWMAVHGLRGWSAKLEEGWELRFTILEVFWFSTTWGPGLRMLEGIEAAGLGFRGCSLRLEGAHCTPSSGVIRMIYTTGKMAGVKMQ